MSSNAQRWKEIYDQGHVQLAPWDEVVSFVHRHKPDRPHHDIHVMEVGCGTGSNLAFLDRSGFMVSGIDQDEKAIFNATYAYYDNHPISAPSPDYRVGDFCGLPWTDDKFDLVIDRAALTYVSGKDLATAISEIHRVLVPGGKFLFTPYAVPGDWRAPFNLPDLFTLIDADKWDMVSVNRVDVVELMGEKAGTEITSHYRVVAQKRKTA